MFLGHFAAGLAAKRAAPGVSLGTLFLAAQFADVLWPLLVAAGIERVRIDPGNTAVTPLAFDSYPYSHSLLLLAVWGTGFGVLWHGRRAGRGAVLVLGALVLSHWALDAISHRPDMPLYPGGVRVGLGLWHSVAATVAAEGVLFAAGLWVYLRVTRPRDAVGRWALAGLAAFLVLVYGVNLFGGPPPSVAAISLTGIFGFALLIAWAWWADRHRTIRAGPPYMPAARVSLPEAPPAGGTGPAC